MAVGVMIWADLRDFGRDVLQTYDVHNFLKCLDLCQVLWDSIVRIALLSKLIALLQEHSKLNVRARIAPRRARARVPERCHPSSGDPAPLPTGRHGTKRSAVAALVAACLSAAHGRLCACLGPCCSGVCCRPARRLRSASRRRLHARCLQCHRSGADRRI